MVKEQIKGIVNLVSGIKEHNGKIQIGWTLDDKQKWYNQEGTEAELEVLLKEIISKGNEIQFSCEGLSKEVSKLVKTGEAPEEVKGKGKTWEDDIIDFKTLLNAAHKKSKGEFSIETECIKVDLEKKYALFKASVIVGKDFKKLGDLEIPRQVFEGHGDATEENVTGDFIKPHFIRMAETRAICRALRWYTNNATCSEEEKSKEPEPEAK